MNLTEIQLIVLNLTASSIPIIIFSIALKFYFSPYIQEKAKNLATREDIGKITSEIQMVNSQYEAILESQKFKYQISITALERRLDTHQKAYTLWFKLLSAVHDANIGQVAEDSQKWWYDNCLYLSPLSRNAFLAAVHAAFFHKDYLHQWKLTKDDSKLLENFEKIKALGTIIASDVALPGLSENDLLEIRNNNLKDLTLFDHSPN